MLGYRERGKLLFGLATLTAFTLAVQVHAAGLIHHELVASCYIEDTGGTAILGKSLKAASPDLIQVFQPNGKSVIVPVVDEGRLSQEDGKFAFVGPRISLGDCLLQISKEKPLKVACKKQAPVDSSSEAWAKRTSSWRNGFGTQFAWPSTVDSMRLFLRIPSKFSVTERNSAGFALVRRSVTSQDGVFRAFCEAEKLMPAGVIPAACGINLSLSFPQQANQQVKVTSIGKIKKGGWVGPAVNVVSFPATDHEAIIEFFGPYDFKADDDFWRYLKKGTSGGPEIWLSQSRSGESISELIGQ